MQRLQLENRILKELNKKLTRKLRTVMDQQSAREEEIRGLQRAQTRMVNHIFNDNGLIETAPRNNSHVNQDATCIDSDD